MNTYYNLLKYLKAIFELDSTVSTIITGNETEIDNYKKNMFPLVHINFVNSPFISNENLAVVRYNVEITCVDIRDINKEEDRDKFWYNDNRHDNWNTTRAILKRAQDNIIKDVLDEDISLFASTDAEIMSYALENLLDGWQITWTFDVPDTLTTVCDDLDIIDWIPNGVNRIAGDPLDEIKIIFNDVITLGSGTFNLYYEGDFFGEWDETDASVLNNVLTVNTNIASLPVGDYNIQFSSGFVEGFNGVNNPLELTFSVE